MSEKLKLAIFEFLTAPAWCWIALVAFLFGGFINVEKVKIIRDEDDV